MYGTELVNTIQEKQLNKIIQARRPHRRVSLSVSQGCV